MDIIQNKTFDEERALYGRRNILVRDCAFDGPADGESAFKEGAGIQVERCFFNLRYPFWHDHGLKISDSEMTELCRAALWYSDHIEIQNTKLHGIKALRECDDTTVENCDISSPEFGWICRGMKIRDTKLVSEYPFFQSRNLEIDGLTMQGKYSFQYVENMTIRNSNLDTKDAFWHSKNVTVEDSVVKGEYLGWYCENLTLRRCRIIGTQPLCYAKGLVLEDCQMENCDLAFEYSDVQAEVKGEIESVKNPRSGHIVADSIGEIILDEHRPTETSCSIETRT